MTEKPDFDQIKDYFDKRIQEHGASPKGADWNGEASQVARFDQLLKIINVSSFSLVDYGCGYGALADYLVQKGYNCDYFGFDILENAIATAQKAHAGKHKRTFLSEKSKLPECDYVVASGTFNFRGEHSFENWTELVIGEMSLFNQISRRGFASNFLTKYSDADRMRPDLYYADPLFLFDYCKRNFSRNVAILHDYGLYDFTILVRKDI